MPAERAQLPREWMAWPRQRRDGSQEQARWAVVKPAGVASTAAVEPAASQQRAAERLQPASSPPAMTPLPAQQG